MKDEVVFSFIIHIVQNVGGSISSSILPKGKYPINCSVSIDSKTKDCDVKESKECSKGQTLHETVIKRERRPIPIRQGGYKGKLNLPSILLTILLPPNEPALINSCSMNETIIPIFHFFDYNQSIHPKLLGNIS